MAAEKRELAKQDYMNGMKYKDIAEKYGVSLNTVKSRKKDIAGIEIKCAPWQGHIRFFLFHSDDSYDIVWLLSHKK